MAKGRKSGRVGGTVVVHELTCGRVFTGDNKWVEAQYKLHCKSCVRCQMRGGLIVDEATANPDWDVNDIRVAGIANAVIGPAIR